MANKNKNPGQGIAAPFIMSGTPTAGDTFRLSPIVKLKNDLKNTKNQIVSGVQNPAGDSLDLFNVMDTVDRQESFE